MKTVIAEFSQKRSGFTLIELLIVVAIITILAAIAVPNFLEAQTRAKVARAKADMRTVAIGLESYSMDHNDYPEGTDNPSKYPQSIADRLGALASGYYTFRTRDEDGKRVGVDFHGLTTPLAYIASIPGDPFVKGSGPFTYCYRNAKLKKNGWILTSIGPDSDLMAINGVGSANAQNPFGTFRDPKQPARIGDINERAVIHFIEGTMAGLHYNRGRLESFLNDLAYDPTNGTLSEGDLYRIGP